MWNFEYRTKYISQYKSLNPDLRNKVKDALNILANSENPLTLGEYKKSLGVWAYVLDRDNRILYHIRAKDNIIELYRVGDHKQTYGKG